MRMLIQNGTVVNATGKTQADVLVEDGKILQVAEHIHAPEAEVIDAAGRLVLPGFIDTHTHLDLQAGNYHTADDFSSGSIAAILGGTTTVLDFATQERGMTTLEAFSDWSKLAQNASCNYGFHMAVSEWNEDRLNELDALCDLGVTSLKMYMVYDNMVVSDGEIYAALKETKKRGMVIGVHCENFSILTKRIEELHEAGRLDAAAHPISRPNAVEAEAVSRLMRTAELANSPVYVVHLSTKEGLEEALRARARGLNIGLETCPQYLLLTDECYQLDEPGRFVMSPPLRKQADTEALWQAVATGAIDFIGTDHCSFCLKEKNENGDFAKTPNGGAGVQNRAEILYTYGVATGRITVEQLVDLCAYRPAQYFGLNAKGVIAPGYDADIVLFDPDCNSVISHKMNAHRCDNSPYEGLRISGRVEDVILNGEHVVKDGVLVAAGHGQYVKRGPSGKRL